MANVARAVEYVNTLEADGGTFLCNALECAFAIPGVAALYLISDGEPNGDTYSGVEDTLHRVQEWSIGSDGRQIVCHTTALCVQNQPECLSLMRGIAQVTGGEMQNVSHFDTM